MTDVQAKLETHFEDQPLVPVIVVEQAEHAVPLGEALLEAGIRVLEVTLRTPCALDAISRLRAALPEAVVGAGTVVTVEDYRRVADAGGQFVISPGVTPALLDHGAGNPVPYLPGVATISEMMLGYEKGYRRFKLFPATVAGGVPALKAFAGPFPDVRFCPTGGIGQKNMTEFLAQPNVFAVGGSWLTPSALVRDGDWAGIRTIAAESLAAARASRQ
ncbi:MAG: bifunctional 4-hydroxy-2-oxoglutarate aldolase/2-dehydro-3-deoxy-phosphogluconate aldolase [Gammaproteobacteria bacterium]|nr:MAG: bifunctional 4-hydroxy-2-oxoglutarate aldolase/2-dehydro-3-deoxy-phosphogluconate aldolase [Gammaproteobacteria bacterium]